MSNVILCPAERNELWLFSRVLQQSSPPQFPTIAHNGTNIQGMWPGCSLTLWAVAAPGFTSDVSLPYSWTNINRRPAAHCLQCLQLQQTFVYLGSHCLSMFNVSTFSLLCFDLTKWSYLGTKSPLKQAKLVWVSSSKQATYKARGITSLWPQE